MDGNFESLLFDAASRTDVSRQLSTERLLDAWYSLHNENVTAIVDKTRPRILRIYTHGSFGEFQNLLYDTNSWKQLSGLYGVVPYYRIGGEDATPFIPHAYWFEDFGGGRAVFNEESHTVSFANLSCYVADGLSDLDMGPSAVTGYDRQENRRPALDFGVKLSGDELIINVRYPDEMEQGMVGIMLYPLYTHYFDADGKIHPVEYFQNGFERVAFPHFDEIIGKSITLEDHLCRMPRMTVTSSTGVCRLISQTDKEANNAFKLQVVVETRETQEEIRIRLHKNPLTVKVDPLVRAGRECRIEILADDIVSCKINETPCKVENIDAGRYEARVALPEGEHEVKIESKSALCIRRLHAVHVDKSKIEKMSDAIMKMFWQEQDKKDLLPHNFDLNTLGPLYREGASHFSHDLRALPMLLVGARSLDRKEYVEQAFRSLMAVAERSHCFEDGSLLSAIALDMKGQPTHLDGCRPSDLGIAIRSFIYAARVFSEMKEPSTSKQCLDHAIGYAKSLLRMQRQDGAFWSRYSFPDLRPTTDMVGTVNNWMIQVWDLIEMYKDYDAEICSRLREMLRKYVDFEVFERVPSLLQVVGGADEGPANYHDDLATAAAILGMKYVLSREEQYRKYAQDAFKMSFFFRDHRLDSPETYMFPCTIHLGLFYDQPFGVPVKGGMCDKTGNEAGIFLKRLLGYDFGECVAAYSTLSRLLDCKPNGGLYGVTINVPNYRYRRECSAETLNYGGLGIVMFWLQEKHAAT